MERVNYNTAAKPLPKRFLSGHAVLDRILEIDYGSPILVLDETFTEARNFLTLLLENYAKPNLNACIQVLSKGHSTSAGDRTYEVGDMNLSDLSIYLNDLRRKHQGHVFINTFLPDVAIRNSTDDLLRLLQAWKKNIDQAG